MEKKILIAVDDAAHSRTAVQYAASLSTVIDNLSFILFHSQPFISQYVMDEARHDPMADIQLSKMLKKNREKAKGLLDRFQSQMIEAGIEASRVKQVTQPKKSGVAKDILDYALANQVDAVVVGRRGLTKVQKAFIGSVTGKLLEHSQVTPVWVINEKVESSKILVAVDGSEGSLRAVDHVAFMLSNNTDAAVTLLHVKPRFRDYAAIDLDIKETDLGEVIAKGEKKQIDDFLGHAFKKFKDAGIQEDQVHVKDVACHVNIGKTIIKEAQKGKFGTVVMGRSGTNNSFFFGSVSRYVLEKAAAFATWLVP